MGNRAVITTAPYKASNAAIYVQWNGGVESIEAFCGAAKELGYLSPDDDPSYSMARLTGLICLYFDITNSTSIGVGTCTNFGDPGDNGIWQIGADWQIVAHGKGKAKPPKNDDPEKTAMIRKQLIVGARLCATVFTENMNGTTVPKARSA